MEYQIEGTQISNPLSRIIIESYYKPSSEARYFINLEYKMSTEYYMFLLNTLFDLICDVIIAGYEAAIWVKSIYYKIVIESKKIGKYGNKRNFYIKLRLTDGVGMAFTVCYKAS